MNRPAWVLGLVLMGGSAIGCGGDDGPKAMPGTVNAPLARSSVQQSVMVRMAADSMNGAGVASAVMALNGSASGIVGPQSSASALLNSDVEQAAQAQQATGVTCDASGCKYTNYMAGGSTLNGTVNVTAGSGDGKNVKWDLTIKNSGLSGGVGGFGFDYTGKGDIQVSPTSLTGEVTTKTMVAGSQGGQSFQGGSESLLRYNAVVIANGQPTGGSLYAKTTSFGSSGGQSAAQAYEGTLEFK